MNRPPLKERLHRSEPDAAALERVWSGVKERRRPGPALWLGLAAVGAAAAGALFVVLRPEPPPGAVAGVSVVQLGDGSFVELEADARFEHAGDGRALALKTGRARFTLEGAAPPWVVSSRHLRLQVASATFSLALSGETDSVSVTRGTVRLATAGAGEVVLTAGQVFTTGAVALPAWEALAREGDLPGAWRLLGRSGVHGQAAAASPEMTMLLSDVAAAGGDEALSRELLQSVVHASDGGAQRALAAYTLGVRLQTDGALEDAARAFEQSVELGLPLELRREAHLRAAESWRGAGDPERARRVLERAPAR